MNRSNFRLALLGLALGVLLALIIAPQTRLLLKMQVLADTALDTTGNQSPHQEQEERFVQQHPNDYQIQLAGPFDPSRQTLVGHARSLVPRFPDNPSLRANILRYAMLRDIHLVRDEDYLLEEQPIPKAKPGERLPHNAPAQLAAFEADAAAGEHLDPGNAYFPFMRSVGLFAAHQDAEGLAAVQRASEKTQWKDYSGDEVEGRLRINRSLNGGQEAIASIAVDASLLLPQYADLRAVARLVTYKAVLAEQAGRPLAGLALRRALARCGYLMTTQSPVIIGSLVGIAISEVARSRPGGAPPLKSGLDAVRDPRTRKQIVQQRLDGYVAYVRRLGQENAAQEAQAQFAGEQAVLQTPIAAFVMGQKTTDFMRLLSSLAFGWVLVTNLLTLALAGLAAWGLNRLSSIREGRSLPTGVSAGAGIALALALLGIVFLHDTPPEQMENTVLGVFMDILIPLAGLAIFAVLRPSFRKPLGRGLLAGLAALIALFALGAISAWKIHPAGDLLSWWNSGGIFDTDDQGKQLPTWTLLGSVVGLVVPILLAIVLTIAARARRVPVSAGLVRGFSVAALPIFCGLIFLYGGLLLWTARQESAANYALEQSMHGEGQYLAELTGQKWPGPVQ